MKHVLRISGMLVGSPLLMIALFDGNFNGTSWQLVLKYLLAFACSIAGAGLMYGFKGFTKEKFSFGTFSNQKEEEKPIISATQMAFILMLLMQVITITLLYPFDDTICFEMK